VALDVFHFHPETWTNNRPRNHDLRMIFYGMGTGVGSTTCTVPSQKLAPFKGRLFGGGCNHRVIVPKGITDEMWDETICDLPALKKLNKTYAELREEARLGNHKILTYLNFHPGEVWRGWSASRCLLTRHSKGECEQMFPPHEPTWDRCPPNFGSVFGKSEWDP